MMTRLLIGFLLLPAALFAGCESVPTSETSSGPTFPADQLCMNDCLATGGERGFCTQRCTH
jgi:hypothetical protein